MARQTDPSNRYWWETTGDKTVVGFTPVMLEKMQECFHIVPGKQRGPVREKGPLMSVECLEGLFSIPSPVSGIITFFENKAMNFPDRLTADDTICVITDAKAAAEKKKKVPDDIDDMLQGWQEAPVARAAPRNWAEMPAAMPQGANAPAPRAVRIGDWAAVQRQLQIRPDGLDQEQINRRAMELLQLGILAPEALRRAENEAQNAARVQRIVQAIQPGMPDVADDGEW